MFILTVHIVIFIFDFNHAHLSLDIKTLLTYLLRYIYGTRNTA